MAIEYNAEEIFRIGVEIEKNGWTFYTQAAELFQDHDIKNLLNDLANWESKHIKTFERMRQELPDDARMEIAIDPDNDVMRYLKAAADSHVFHMNKDVGDLVKNCKDARDVLLMALTFEKDSVVVYTSMKNVVSEKMGKEKVDILIIEELTHIAMLKDELEKL